MATYFYSCFYRPRAAGCKMVVRQGMRHIYTCEFAAVVRQRYAPANCFQWAGHEEHIKGTDKRPGIRDQGSVTRDQDKG